MKIKTIISLVVLLFIFTYKSYSQTDGEPILKVYSNFNTGLSNEDNSTAFEVKRVYLGYKANLSENFRAEAKLDIGSPENISQLSIVSRYAYFKTAYLEYHQDNLSVYFGLFGMLQFDKQEKIWGYRYISKSFMDEFKYGPSADIGIGARYRVNDYIETDLVISNGEGYKYLQEDNSYKTGIGLSLFPVESVILRVYYDVIAKEELESVFSIFMAYKAENFRIGAELNNMYNNSFVSNNDLKGYSIYSTYTFNDKWGIFARYDQLNSNVLSGETQAWNINDDGSFITSGIEYTPVSNIKCALNYQDDWVSSAIDGPYKSYLYFNVEFKL